jgi:hypothetical protein
MQVLQFGPSICLSLKEPSSIPYRFLRPSLWTLFDHLHLLSLRSGGSSLIGGAVPISEKVELYYRGCILEPTPFSGLAMPNMTPKPGSLDSLYKGMEFTKMMKDPKARKAHALNQVKGLEVRLAQAKAQTADQPAQKKNPTGD